MSLTNKKAKARKKILRSRIFSCLAACHHQTSNNDVRNNVFYVWFVGHDVCNVDLQMQDISPFEFDNDRLKFVIYHHHHFMRSSVSSVTANSSPDSTATVEAASTSTLGSASHGDDETNIGDSQAMALLSPLKRTIQHIHHCFIHYQTRPLQQPPKPLIFLTDPLSE